MKTRLFPAITSRSWSATFCAGTVAIAVATGSAFAKEAPSKAARQEAAKPVTEERAEKDVKSLDKSIEAGLAFLLKQQIDGGGWGQGGGWRMSRTGGGRVEGKDVEDPADMGNTCVGLMALLRTGSSLSAGEHQKAAAQAFEFICRQVEKADADSLYVTSVRDTQMQIKIGQYVDTFLAGWVLSELKGRVSEGEMEKRRSEALDKVMAKIEKNQKDNGSFEGNNGWASVLSQGLCSKALNGASRAGAKVSAEALAKDQRQNEEGLDKSVGRFAAPSAAEPSSAGVNLYREASKLGGLWEKNVTNGKAKKEAEAVVAKPDAKPEDKDRARQELARIQKEDDAAQAATKAVTSQIGDSKFVAGFGNNGGEEFLSYLTLAEALRAKGGKEWDDWKSKASLTIRTAQNEDGGWSGNHCITGRNFCTGTAVLVLVTTRDAGGVAAVPEQAPKVASGEVAK